MPVAPESTFASVATVNSVAVAVSHATGSTKLTPYSAPATAFAAPSDNSVPIAIPTAAMPRPWRITRPTTADRLAPSAIRIPISRVRRATEYAITPYSPIDASSIATTPTALTPIAPAFAGSSVAATCVLIVWLSRKRTFGSSASSSRRIAATSAAASPRVRAMISWLLSGRCVTAYSTYGVAPSPIVLTL